MTEDEIKALKAKRQARLERAIQPQGSGYARRRITTPAQARPIDWNYYRHKPKVEPWEACALALNINPNSLILTTDGMGALGSGIVTFKGLPNDEAADSFLKLLQLLNANQTENFAMGVRLSEFAAWCAPIVRDITGHDIPQELAALAVSAKLPQATGESGDAAGKVEAGTALTTNDNESDDAEIHHSGLDGAPPLKKGKNSCVKVAVWVKWQAKKMVKQNDTLPDLIGRIKLEANKWGYESERKPLTNEIIRKMLPPKITGGREKIRGKSKK